MKNGRRLWRAMRVITVVGARPNFMKAAPLIAAIQRHNDHAARAIAEDGRASLPIIDHLLVHTGQHYDAVMSDSFFADLNLPAPDIRLEVGSGSHAIQTAEVLTRFEGVLLRERPDLVIVVGDVNSTVGCALATARISFDSVGTRPLLAHVEAGLRSFDRLMPEEVNRIVTDHVCDLLFVTEKSGISNLKHEGISSNRVHFVGNTMIDSLLAFEGKAESSTILEKLKLVAQGGRSPITQYVLLTLHRPSNVDNPMTFRRILAALDEVGANHPIVFPVHPRTRQRIKEFGLAHAYETKDAKDTAGLGFGYSPNGIILTDPQSYLDFLCLMKHAALVVTDSGGVQEETTCLGIPCVTVRENTERPVTVERGTNILAGTTTEKIRSAVQQQIARKDRGSRPEKWDGRAATRILDVLVDAYCREKSPEPALF